MIIPALVSLYDRMLADGDEDLAPPGYSRQQIGFQVVLERDGTLFQIQQVSVTDPPAVSGKAKAPPRTRPKKVLVPGQSKPSGSGLNPCFLWDNASYMLGLVPEGRDSAWATSRFEAFRDRHLGIKDAINDPHFDAVCAFLKTWSPAHAEKHRDILTNFGVFTIRAEPGFVHERPAIESWWRSQSAQSGEDTGSEDLGTPRSAPALGDGSTQRIARLHEPKIKGVAGAQSSGATLVSFNCPSFESYAKEQGDNAPVGVDDAFKYCTVLNRLTGDPARRVRLAGDTVVFWSEGAPKAESLIADFFGSPVADPDAAERARQTYERAARGESDSDIGDPATPFYILGQAPNAARISVRLWLRSSVGEVSTRINQFIRDTHMEPIPEHAPPPTIYRLVLETAPPASRPGFPDADSVVSDLASGVLTSVLNGGAFPARLLLGVLNRCRVEGLADQSTRKDWRDAQHRRCSIIRGCLLRAARASGHEKEVPVSLNADTPEPAYQLGRLFAVLERAQRDALGDNLNVTIKDRYFGAAMTMPGTVFPRLLKLSQHHLRGIGIPGRRVAREKELGEVIGRLQSYPRMLGLEDQGLFAIGYYHQRQSYFTRKEPEADLAAAETTS